MTSCTITYSDGRGLHAHHVSAITLKSGERKLLIFQNLHRFAMYFALLFLVFLWHDAYLALWFPDADGVVRYINKSVMKLLGDAQNDIRQSLPDFDVRADFAAPTLLALSCRPSAWHTTKECSTVERWEYSTPLGIPVVPLVKCSSAGVSATLIAPLSRRVNVVAIAGLDRLVGDAADSPRVLERGAATQMTVGAFVTYRIF